MATQEGGSGEDKVTSELIAPNNLVDEDRIIHRSRTTSKSQDSVKKRVRRWQTRTAIRTSVGEAWERTVTQNSGADGTGWRIRRLILSVRNIHSEKKQDLGREEVNKAKESTGTRNMLLTTKSSTNWR